MTNKWIVTAAFCKADLLELCLKNLHISFPIGFTHIVIDGHYPIDKDVNRIKIQNLCKKYHCRYLDPGQDLGLHENLNYAVNTCNIGANDIFVCCDPDDFPEPGSIDLLAKVIETDRSIAVLGLSFDLIQARIQQGTLQLRQAGPHLVYYHPTVEMFKTVAFNMRFIHSMPGKFKEERAYYGGIESYLYTHWKRLGLKLAYITPHCENVPIDKSNPKYFDTSYRQWKDDHLAGYVRSFEQWLNEKKCGAI